jgi:hypothetical protein
VSLAAFYVAATVTSLIQLARVRDARLVPLLLLFLFQAIAHTRDDWFAARPWHFAAGLSGLALLFLLKPRHPAGR